MDPFTGGRSDPPVWKRNVLDSAVVRMRPLYKQLLELDISAAEFEELWESHSAMLASVCRRTTDRVRAKTGIFADLCLPPGFLVRILDCAQGDDTPKLLRLNLSQEKIGEHGVLHLEASRQPPVENEHSNASHMP